MKKVAVIWSSPNQDGLTASAKERFAEGLRELGVNATDEDLEVMAHKCAVGVDGEKGSAKLLREADMLAIFRASR